MQTFEKSSAMMHPQMQSTTNIKIKELVFSEHNSSANNSEMYNNDDVIIDVLDDTGMDSNRHFLTGISEMTIPLSRRVKQ